MSSARSREWYRSQYSPLTYDTAIVAAGTTENVLAVKSANHKVYVQAILVVPSVGAAEAVTFQDDASTPVVVAKTKATAVQGESYLFDFGPEGFPLTLGKNLDMIVAAGGVLRAAVHVEGYEKLGATIAHNAGASLQ